MLRAFVVVTAWICLSVARSQTPGAPLVNTQLNSWLFIMARSHLVMHHWFLSASSSHLGAAASTLVPGWGPPPHTRFRVRVFFLKCKAKISIDNRCRLEFSFTAYCPCTCSSLCIHPSRLLLWLCSRWCWWGLMKVLALTTSDGGIKSLPLLIFMWPGC